MTAARILVVDDEADISTILTVTLRRAGYEVASAADGIEALEAIHRQAPDLILLDVMMPRSDGLETLKRIRQHPPTAQVPVIMLTARAGLADKMKGFERGADDYVAKPFEPAEIVVRVAALLKRSTHSRVVSPLLSVLGDWFTTERISATGSPPSAWRSSAGTWRPRATSRSGCCPRCPRRWPGSRRARCCAPPPWWAATSSTSCRWAIAWGSRSATSPARGSRPRSSW